MSFLQSLFKLLVVSVCLTACATTPQKAGTAPQSSASSVSSIPFQSQLRDGPASYWTQALPEAFRSCGLISIREMDGREPGMKIVIGDTLSGESVVIKYQEVTAKYTLVFYGATDNRIQRLVGDVLSHANLAVTTRNLQTQPAEGQQ